MQLETPKQRNANLGVGLRLEYFSLTWNTVELIVGIGAGILAGSVALVGFGLDSAVETSSAAILLWRLRAEQKGTGAAEDLERKAVRWVAIAFYALALYVGVRAALDLLARSRPAESTVGIILAIVSLIVMPTLAWRKRVAARQLDSRALQADSKQTQLCTYLSAFLLVGLLANAWFGWYWADPVAGLLIAAFAACESRELWNAEDFCCR
jgi:divalent metal cation (Fe/Co/Zn/Cd) transporter